MKRITTLLCALVLVASTTMAQRVGGFFPNWVNPNLVDNVQWDYITDTYYAFAQPTDNGGVDIGNTNARNVLTRLSATARLEGVKVHVSFGGAAQGDRGWAQMISTATRRQNFANACADLVQQYNLDGISLDWEFPSGTQATNFADVAVRVRAALDGIEGTVGRELILSAAVAPLIWNDEGINSTFLNQMDYIHVMAFDDGNCFICGGPNHSSMTMARNAFLHWTTGIPGQSQSGRGVAPSKIDIAIPFYSNSRQAFNSFSNSDPAGFFNDTDGSRGGQLYNSCPMIQEKADYVIQNGGGGLWTWELSQDRTDQYSLTRCMFNALDVQTCDLPEPALGNDQSICGLNSITLNSGVSTGNNRRFTWRRNGQVIVNNSTSQNTYRATQTGTYIVTVSNGTCEESDEIVISGTLPTVDLGGPYNLCNPAEVELSSGLNGNAYSFTWRRDGQVVSNSGSNYTATEAGNYSLTISATSCGSIAFNTTVTSSLPEVEDDVMCRGGSAELSVSDDVIWYSSPSSSNALAGPASVYNPIISSTQTFWVATEGTGNNTQSETIMKPALANNGWYQQPFVYGQRIIVESNLTINSVDIDAQGNGTAVFNIVEGNGTTVVESVSQSVSTGVNTLDLNIALEPGTYYMNLVGTTPAVRIDITQGSPNYSINGVITVEGTAYWDWSAPYGNEYVSSNQYGNFSNLVIETGGGVTSCERIPVMAIIDQNDPNCRADVLNAIADRNTFMKLEVFPNPAFDEVNFTQDFRNAALSLIDMQGRLVFEQNDFNGQSLNVSSLENGSYLLKVETADQNYHSLLKVE